MNSTIDNLNFAVIIDDTEFNDQIKKMETEAKRFNTSMSNLLDLKKQAQQWSQKDVENMTIEEAISILSKYAKTDATAVFKKWNAVKYHYK